MKANFEFDNWLEAVVPRITSALVRGCAPNAGLSSSSNPLKFVSDILVIYLPVLTMEPKFVLYLLMWRPVWSRLTTTLFPFAQVSTREENSVGSGATRGTHHFAVLDEGEGELENRLWGNIRYEQVPKSRGHNHLNRRTSSRFTCESLHLSVICVNEWVSLTERYD